MPAPANGEHVRLNAADIIATATRQSVAAVKAQIKAKIEDIEAQVKSGEIDAAEGMAKIMKLMR